MRPFGIALVFFGCASSGQGSFDAGSCANAICAALPVPDAVVARAGGRFALVSWAPVPAADGYTVVATTPSETPVVVQSPVPVALVAGLSDGFGYAITVAATAEGGTGPFSAPVPVTPRSVCARSFALHRTYATGAAPSMVALGDVDDDGFLDVAVAQSAGVGIFRNDRTGNLLARVDLPTASTPQALVAADFNGDGLADLAAGGATTQVFFSQADGGFAAADLGFASTLLAAGDVTGDNQPDLVSTSDQLRVRMESGDGGFQVPDAGPPIAAPALLAVADLDGDGIADVVATGPGQRTFSVLHSFADGGLLAPPESHALGADPTWVATGDFDGDSLQDIAFGSATGQILIHLQNGDAGTGADGGAFSGGEVAVAAGAVPSFVAAADLDSDNFADLVYTSEPQDLLGVLFNQRDGGFGAPLLLPTGKGPAAVAIGDLNGDGFPDLAVVSRADATLAVYLSVCAQ
jgi:hypothetical protein